MTRTTFRMKIAVSVLLAVTGIGAASIRLDRPARADERRGNQANPNAIVPPAPKARSGV